MKDLLLGIYALAYYKCLHYIEDCMNAIPEDEMTSEWLMRRRNM